MVFLFIINLCINHLIQFNKVILLFLLSLKFFPLIIYLKIKAQKCKSAVNRESKTLP